MNERKPSWWDRPLTPLGFVGLIFVYTALDRLGDIVAALIKSFVAHASRTILL